jgi:ABC-2 type transport system permease protein
VRKLSTHFSFVRLWAMIVKEFIQMKRDKPTLGMIVGIPLILLLLFGYAINSNPKHLPTLVIDADNTVLSRTFIQDIKNTDYFDIMKRAKSEQEATRAIEEGTTQFVINIPAGFMHDLIREKQPDILLTADATESMAAANALAAANTLATVAFNRELTGSLSYLSGAKRYNDDNGAMPYFNSPSSPFNLRIHAKYNPELISQYNIVPALMGVILTMMMVIITALAITREYEHGTMENLLATPVRPLEVMLGKVIPFIVVGYVQVILILLAAYFLFHVPINGSIALLLLSTFPFIVANLSVGITFSTLAKNQLQATQLTYFFFLPSMLLSGFMFPFYGMPQWAQYLGNTLPLTYYLRIVRGIMLKGNGFMETWPSIWPIIVFMFIALIVGVLRYRETLD